MRGTSPRRAEGQPGLLQRCRLRYPWLDRLARAGQSYTIHHGDHYAAAITFFSVLSLVPMLMIAFAAAGFVLARNPELLRHLQDQIQSAAPPGLGPTLDQVISEAIKSRDGVGIVGLLGALYSGLGWMANLREALTAQWSSTQWSSTQGSSTQGSSTQGSSTQGSSTQGRSTQGEQPPEPEGFLCKKVFDLLALLGLGLALVASFALTGVGTAFAGVALNALGLGQVIGARLVLRVLAVVASVTGMWLVFLWVLARLPRKPVALRSATRAAWAGAIGFEILKQGFALYLGSVTNSPTGRLFGPVIGLMVFAYFVSRFLLFLTAWAATPARVSEGSLQAPHEVPPSPPAQIPPDVVVGSRPDVPR